MSDRHVTMLRLLCIALVIVVAFSASECIAEYDANANRAAALRAEFSSITSITETAAPATSARTPYAYTPYTPPAPDPATATNPDGVPIAETLPYKGMPASLIDDTWLGEHDGTEEPLDSGNWSGATPYYWIAHNGTGDKVFTAYVLDGKVAKIIKWDLYKDYWSIPGESATRDLPDLYAAGERVERPKLPAKLPDPADYTDPDLYAMDAEDYFREHGSENPTRDAENYWWDNY